MQEAAHAAPIPHVLASAISIEDGVQRRGECTEVTVVHAAVLQLAGQLAEKRRPVSSRGRKRHVDLDLTLDHFHS